MEYTCDWWLETRAKCDEPATINAVDEYGAPWRYCAMHWPLAQTGGQYLPRVAIDPDLDRRAYQRFDRGTPDDDPPDDGYTVTGCRSCDALRAPCPEHAYQLTIERLDTLRLAALAAYDADAGTLSRAVSAYYTAVAAATCGAAAYDVSMGRFDWDRHDLDTPADDFLADYRAAYSACGAHGPRSTTCPDCAELPDLSTLAPVTTEGNAR